jgi:hypothetical protein
VNKPIVAAHCRDPYEFRSVRTPHELGSTMDKATVAADFKALADRLAM